MTSSEVTGAVEPITVVDEVTGVNVVDEVAGEVDEVVGAVDPSSDSC